MRDQPAQSLAERPGNRGGLNAAGALSAAFGAVGVATLAAYAVLWLEPLWLGRFSPFGRGAEAIATILGLDAAGALQYVAAFGLPMTLYIAALLLAPRVPGRAGWTVALAVAVAAPLVLLYTYPALAADVFDYLFGGRIVSEYGRSPYTTPPSHFEGDVYYPPVGWKDLLSVYGPLWVISMAAITEVCGSNAVAALLAVKGVSIGAHLATAALVYATARRIAPGRELLAFVAYSWSPLALVHFAVDGHNDSVLLLFLMAALYMGLLGRWDLALPFLTLSVLIKFVPLVLLPLFLWSGRADKQSVAAGLGASAFVALFLYMPFWAGVDTFDGVRDQASRSTSSLTAVADFYLSRDLVRAMATVAFAGGYVLVLARRGDVVRGSYSVLLIYLLVLSAWTRAWYFTWPLALGAVIGGPAFWISVPGTIGLFVANLFGGWGWELNWFDWRGHGGLRLMEALLTACTLGGWLLGAAGYTVLRRLRRSARTPSTGRGGSSGLAQGPANTTA